MSTAPRHGGVLLRSPSGWTVEDLNPQVDLLRLDAARKLDPNRRSELGQFMTPAPVAALMASKFTPRPGEVRLLDAGAGVGSLTAAAVARFCQATPRPSRIAVTAYEVDPRMREGLALTLDACVETCRRFGVAFDSDVRPDDFIASGVSLARPSFFNPEPEQYDCAILNPPYKKIQSDSPERRRLRLLGIETSNLYAAFLAIVVRLLRTGGELVAITPRSFCNGPYFTSFRQDFLRSMALEGLHSFEARDEAFSDDSVLQENVILHATKQEKRPRTVVVSSSFGPEDEWPAQRAVAASRIVRPDDPDCFIHIPADALSERIDERMASLGESLLSLGIEVSTGRVVDFRSQDALRQVPGPGTVPLLYPSHMSNGAVCWPKEGRKPNALALHAETEDLLVPPGHYVLVKRFSSKEERRRIVAAVTDPKGLPDSRWAFENHLNYFHRNGGPLEADVAGGLAAFLNSTIVDCHFRDWSGHTQVNAHDLRRLRYPAELALVRLGKAARDAKTQDALDDVVEDCLFRRPGVKRSRNPIPARRRVREATSILREFGLPAEQQNERSALTLLALADLTPTKPWSKAADPLRGITQMMGFFKEHYGKEYAPNSRETVRRQTVHQFVAAGLAVINPDDPKRPTNSGKTVYQIEPRALAALREFGGARWDDACRAYLSETQTLRERYARERAMARIPLAIAPGKSITLSPGGQNVLVKQIVDEFCPRFTPGGKPLYVGDTDEKFAYFDAGALKELGVTLEEHGKMPDLVIHHQTKGWLVLIEAVTSHGPVNPKRHDELKRLFSGSKAGLVFVTAFLTRRDLMRYVGEIDWETEVWVADAPSHLIHFNGERFLGPF